MIVAQMIVLFPAYKNIKKFKAKIIIPKNYFKNICIK